VGKTTGKKKRRASADVVSRGKPEQKVHKEKGGGFQEAVGKRKDNASATDAHLLRTTRGRRGFTKYLRQKKERQKNAEFGGSTGETDKGGKITRA